MSREPLFRIGQGFDVHALGPGDHVMLGGVRIPHVKGIVAHSDGDVLLHALCDALLGALSMGDIGQHFPPTDAQWADADSLDLLRAVHAMVIARGWRIGNVDTTVLAEKPRVGPHVDAMRQRIANVLVCDADAVSIKATTTEKLGFTGREEGIAASAVVLLMRNAE